MKRWQSVKVGEDQVAPFPILGSAKKENNCFGWIFFLYLLVLFITLHFPISR